MIPADIEARIVRLHCVEHWTLTAIGREVGVHPSTVRRVLADKGAVPAGHTVRSPSISDPYREFIADALTKYPDIPASAVYGMVKERGYPGAPDHFRKVVAALRPRRPVEAFLRRTTLSGEEGQVDWGSFGKIQVCDGQRALSGFVMVLSHSRGIFLRFSLDQRMGSFLRGHAEAFARFNGVPRVLLYDNLKSVVLERRADAMLFNDTLLHFAKHYRFEPRPCNVARGNEKGRVERGIRYIRDSFFHGRSFVDLADLNAQADRWCRDVAGERRWVGDRTMTVTQAIEEEKPRLLSLPDDNYPTEDRLQVVVGKTPYIRFDRNDYSVPHDHVQRSLTVLADASRVRILAGDTVVATHERSWASKGVVEDPAHVAELVEEKRRAKQHHAQGRLTQAVPSVQAFLRLAGERGHGLGTTVAALVKLLDRHGPAELAAAVAVAVAAGTPHPGAVRQILDRRMQEAGRVPPVPVDLPDDPRVRDLSVVPHGLATYDSIGRERP
jgi:transposase